MRIGIDARLWNQTGVGRYVRNLVKYLQVLDKKNEYVLFVRSKDYDGIKFQISNPIQSDSNFKFQIVKSDIRWHSFEEQIKFPLILNKEKLNLVHFPYFSVPVFYNKPYVITIHDLIIDHFPTGKASSLPFPVYYLKKFGYKIVLKKAAQNAKKIIVPSSATRQEIIDHLRINPDKVVVTYEGADLENPKQTQNVKIGNEKINGNWNSSTTLRTGLENGKFFLYVGNAYPHKNLERLIKAFDLFVKEQKDKPAELILVGKEDYFYKRLKERIKNLDIGENVRFYGFVSDNELSLLYKNAKAIIAPSLMEGFGLTALEAMARGKIVLASNIPAIKEVCEGVPLYFNPKDVLDIKEKLSIIYKLDKNDISEKEKLGFKIAKKYSWKKMAKETLSIYEDCIGI